MQEEIEGLGIWNEEKGFMPCPASGLDDMRVFLKEHAPFSWEILKSIAQGSIMKSNMDFVTLVEL